MRSHRTRRFLSVMTLLGFGSMGVASAVEPAPRTRGTTYYYFKEPRTLEIDPTRIALLTRGVVANTAVGRASHEGVERDRIASWNLPGWSMLPTRVDARTPQRVVRSVETLSSESEFDFVTPVYLGERGGPVLLTPELLVRFHSRVSPRQAEAIFDQLGAGKVLTRDWANMRGAYLVRTDARDAFAVLELSAALAQRDDVIFAEPNFIFTGRGELTPNDTQFGDLWGLHNTGQAGGTPDVDMDAPEAWEVTLGDPSIKIVIIDVGVQLDHPDINQLPGMDLTTNPDTPGGGPQTVPW